MSFYSILFERPDSIRDNAPGAPVLFADLNLDQVVSAITSGREEYNLIVFFQIPLNTIEAITYRHEIMRDLHSATLLEHINSFAQKMRTARMRHAQAEELRYKYQKEACFLEAAEIYCDAVRCLERDLVLADPKSRGLVAFQRHLKSYIESDRFTSLTNDTTAVGSGLNAIKYSLLIKDDRFTVRAYDAELDYCAEIESAFERFKHGAVKDYTVTFRNWPEMNHIEEKVLEFVARLYPQVFSTLDTYCEAHSSYLDDTIARFDREIQFYVAYLEHVARFTQQGLAFCYPAMCNQDKEIYAHEAFDLALANRLRSEHLTVVCNDFYLKDGERIFVVSGPNQGGKTTFARSFGQLHYLASLGCPVPGKKARLFLFDRLFTHFEKEEDIRTLRGGLEDSLIRFHDILDRATSNSIIIMNEIFASTTLQDALLLGTKVLRRLIDLDLLCVCVTFMDELALLSEQTVSMVSTVVPENPVLRTYKIERKPPDGLAWAISIAEKYRLTYDRLMERLRP